MYVANTKTLISFAITAKLICVFVFAYAKCWFSHDVAHILFAIVSIISRVAGLVNNSKLFFIV